MLALPAGAALRSLAFGFALCSSIIGGVQAQGAGMGTSVPSAASTLPPTRLLAGDALEGTFLPLTVERRAWSDGRWREEFGRLRGLGFDTLVIQWSVYDDVSFVDDGIDGGRGTIGRVLDAADAVGGLDVYVGLSLRGSWWRPAEVTPAYLREELARNVEVAARLHAELRDARAFRGWYVPHEYSEIVFAPEQRDGVLDFYAGLTRELRRLDPLKPVLASGYTDPAKTQIVRFTLRWREFLDRAGVDTLVFQDGAGVARGGHWRDVLPYLEALAILDEEFDGDVWFLAETFAQTAGPPVGQGEFAAEPAGMGRLGEQIDAFGAFRRKLVAYSYFDYMLPGAGPRADALHDAYAAWLAGREAALGPRTR